MERKQLKEALDTAAKLGAADTEVVFSRGVNLDIEVADGKVETLLTAEAIGAGVRTFTKDRRMGFAYSSVLDAGLHQVAEAAWDNAVASDADEHNVLPEESVTSDDDWCEQNFTKTSVADKVDFCRRLEQRTLDEDKRIERVQDASYSDSVGEFTIANSRGLFRTYRNSHCSASVVASASEPNADSEMGWEFDFGRSFGALRLDWIAKRAAERATRALGGKPCNSGPLPVVLDNYVAMQFLQVVAPALMANNVLKGKSLFASLAGEAIASECVTVIDQNDIEAGLRRAPFDGEGASAQRTTIVDGGVLKGYLHNAYTAHRLGTKTTANAARGGFRGVPDVGVTNCYIEPGGRSPEDLVDMAGLGLFVTDAMGVHMADPVSGDFSFGASGLTIEEGRMGRPVRGVTIAGNTKDLLKSIKAAGTDLRFFGSYGAPSLLVSELMIAGL